MQGGDQHKHDDGKGCERFHGHFSGSAEYAEGWEKSSMLRVNDSHKVTA